jgi:hypothetical protein
MAKQPTTSLQAKHDKVCYQACREFLEHYRSQQDGDNTIQDVMKTLTARPEHEIPVNPLGDHEKKIEEARLIHAELKREFTNFEMLGWFYVHPSWANEYLANLKTKGRNAKRMRDSMERFFHIVAPAARRLLQRRTHTAVDLAALNDETKRNVRPEQPLGRSTEARKACLKRDGERCLITRCPHPEVCHVCEYPLGHCSPRVS